MGKSAFESELKRRDEAAMRDQVFNSLDLLCVISVYLSFGDILNLFEVGLGCLGDVLKTRKMKEGLTKQLFSFLVNEGWGRFRNEPARGSISFERSLQETADYAKVFCLVGFGEVFLGLFQPFVDHLLKEGTLGLYIPVFQRAQEVWMEYKGISTLNENK